MLELRTLFFEDLSVGMTEYGGRYRKSHRRARARKSLINRTKYL